MVWCSQPFCSAARAHQHSWCPSLFRGAFAAQLQDTAQSSSYRGGCHPVASGISALPSACSMHPLHHNVLNSQRNFFFFYTKLWSLVCDSDPRSAFVAEKHQQVFQRSCFFRFLSLFSLDLPFLSYLSCMQTHAKKTLPLLSAPARAHYYIPISVHMQGWEVMSETRESLGQRSCEGWTCYTS